MIAFIRNLSLLALCALIGGTATAKDFFQTNRSAILDKMRPAISEIGVPTGEVFGKCGKPLNLKTCRYPLTAGLEIFIVETHSDKVSLEKFMAGADGAIYEIEIQLSTSGRSSAPNLAFRKLCTSAVLAIRSKITPNAAASLVDDLIRRASARTDDPAQSRDSDHFSNVVIDLSPNAFDRCRINAEDDYLPSSGIYKKNEDIP